MYLMSYRISATNDEDGELLDAIRDRAWQERKEVSEVIREAFRARLALKVKTPRGKS
jgi:hypothetical protein